VLSRAGAPAVAIGRRVFVHSLAKWGQLPVTPVLGGAVVAVWVGGLKDAIVATAAGELFRFDGMVWKVIVPAFADASERVLALHPAGAAAFAVVAIGDRGTVLLVDRAASRRVALDARLTDFQARAAASGPAGRLWLAGTARVSGQEAQVLVRLEAGKLVPVDPIPALAPDDAISALLVGRDGSALIATRGGAVHTRSAAGVWSSARADAVLPPDTSHPANPPAMLAIPAQPASR
jgi:hypothetical protein